MFKDPTVVETDDYTDADAAAELAALAGPEPEPAAPTGKRESLASTLNRVRTRIEVEPVQTARLDRPLPEIIGNIVRNQAAAAQYIRAPRRPTELGLAESFADSFGTVVGFEPSMDCWFIWDGTVWTPDRDALVFQAVKQLIRSEGIRAADEGRDADRVTLAKMERTGTIRAILGAAQSEPRLVRHVEDADSDPWKLNCLNGLLDLRTLELAPHSPDQWVTKVTGTDYTPGEYPVFSAFLDSITCGRGDLTLWLVAFLGLGLTGDTSAQVFSVWHGAGSNGKSVLMNLFRHLAGDYAVSIRPDTLLEARTGGGDAPRPDLLALRGGRTVFASEGEEGARLSVALVKSLSGEDAVTARPLYGSPVTFTPQAKIVLVSNHRPRIPRMDDAIRRRLRLVPFDRVFGLAERDPGMLDKLVAEGPAILAALASAASAYYTQGRGARALPPCAEVDAASETYANSEDMVSRFLADRTEPALGSVRSSELYGAFRSWAEAEGEHPFTARAFRNAMSERGHPGHRRENGIHFEGLILK